GSPADPLGFFPNLFKGLQPASHAKRADSQHQSGPDRRRNRNQRIEGRCLAVPVMDGPNMKLTIERGDLLNALSHVQNIVERRTTIPILSNVLLEAKKGELRLTATDLDIEAVDSADAKVSQDGAVTAPAGTLFDVVRK